MKESIYQSINQSINPSNNQSINPPANQSISQSTQPTNQSLKQSINTSSKQAIDPGSNRSSKQSILQAINPASNQSSNQGIGRRRGRVVKALDSGPEVSLRVRFSSLLGLRTQRLVLRTRRKTEVLCAAGMRTLKNLI